MSKFRKTKRGAPRSERPKGSGYLRVAVTELLQDHGKMSRLWRMLIEFWLFASEDQTWRICIVAGRKFLQEGEKVEPLQSVAETGQVALEGALTGNQPGEWLLDLN